MKKTFSFLKFGAVAALLPLVASAQTLFTLGTQIKNILNFVMPILITVAVIYLVVSIIQYVIAGDEEKKAEGRSHMIYGIIGLFVILSIWGLVAILLNTFGTANINLNQNLPFNCPPGTTWNQQQNQCQ